jgi:hypothetical protein
MNQGGRESQKKNADLADGSFTDNSKTSEKREMFSQL